jgi:hypothetical protein
MAKGCRAAAVVTLAVMSVLVAAPASASTQKRFSTSFVVHLNPQTGGPLIGSGTAPYLGKFRYENYGSVAVFAAANGDQMATLVNSPTEIGAGAPCAVNERRVRWTERIVDSDRTGPLSTGRFAHAQGTFAVTACAVVGSDGVAVGDIRIRESGTIDFSR